MARLTSVSSISYSTAVATRAAAGRRSSIASKTPSERTRIAKTSIRRVDKAGTSSVAVKATSTSPRDLARSPGPRDTEADDERKCFPLINLLIIKCYNLNSHIY